MLCDWYLILSCSFPLRHIKHSNISHSFFWCIICYWNLTAPLVVAASWITLLCVTTSLWNTSVCSRGWDKQHLWLLLVEGVIPGAFPVVSGKQTANHREAGQVVDSTDLCEESKRNSQIEPCGRNGFCYIMNYKFVTKIWHQNFLQRSFGQKLW